MTATAPSFADINEHARPYPAFLLDPDWTVLSLFSAGFHGWNDCVHFARKHMRTDCVDIDDRKLAEMASAYPSGWTFTAMDAWDYAEAARLRGEMWDVVSVDPFFEHAAERAWASLSLWLALARRMVTLTVHLDTELELPEGWNGEVFPRGGDVAWLVARHD